MTNHTIFRIFAAILLVAALFGLAGGAFRMGYLQGTAADLQLPEGEGGAAGPYAPYLLFYRPFGFSFLGLMMPLFFFVLAIWALHRLFWGPYHPYMGRYWMHHAAWGARRSGLCCAEWGEAPDWIEEWHRKLHEKSAAGGANSEDRPAAQEKPTAD